MSREIKINNYTDMKRITDFFPGTFTEATEGATIPANTYAWNDTYKALRINDANGTDKKGVIKLNLGKSRIGDLVEAKIEVMNISGEKAKIAIDDVPVGNVFILQSEKTGEFETLGGKFIVNKEGGQLVFIAGTFTADIGDFYVRNIEISINGKNVIPIAKAAVRAYTFVKLAGVWTPTITYHPYKCSLDVGATYITVTHDVPFTNTKDFAGASQAEFSRNSPQYFARTSSESKDGFIVQFFDRATGAIIAPSAIPDNVYFNCVHHGYDDGGDIIY